jgi:hypothetical protein
MSYQYSAIKVKEQTHPKTYFQKYLRNLSEPRDNVFNDTPPELEAELLESSYAMRGQMRRIARRIRNRYS